MGRETERGICDGALDEAQERPGQLDQLGLACFQAESESEGSTLCARQLLPVRAWAGRDHVYDEVFERGSKR